MPRKRIQSKKTQQELSPQEKKEVEVSGGFKLDFLNASQKLAWSAFNQHDILFLIGPAGCGKTHLSIAFAISEILEKKKKKIVLTRPIVEAGSGIGYLPGEASEKIAPYMVPFFDSIDKLCGPDLRQREIIKKSVDANPLCFMRGRNVNSAVFILDEAQNCTKEELKLALTRLGKDSKMIITADPNQSDLKHQDVAIKDLIPKINSIPGISVIEFKASAIVRHPLIAKILAKIE